MATPKRTRPPMRVITSSGLHLLRNLSDADAMTVARHDNAVRKYLYTGDHGDLDEFDGVRVAGHRLETDLDWLDLLALTGEIRFEDIYDQEFDQ
jgi:hypothetical protein